MRTLIVCHSSHHNNTLIIAKIFGAILKADICEPHEVDPLTCMNNYDLIGFGSGIYAARHHESLFTLIDQLPQNKKPVFIFSTKALQFVNFYHKSLRAHLKKKGCFIVEEFSCLGYATYGPLKWTGGLNKGHPSLEDKTNAEKFVKSIHLTLLTHKFN
jgi:flavodoxin